jgi:hypothetical protein
MPAPPLPQHGRQSAKRCKVDAGLPRLRSRRHSADAAHGAAPPRICGADARAQATLIRVAQARQNLRQQRTELALLQVQLENRKGGVLTAGVRV